MLARRFTIVCLLMMLFGMVFAMLVAESGRAAHRWDDDRGCGVFCSALARN